MALISIVWGVLGLIAIVWKKCNFVRAPGNNTISKSAFWELESTMALHIGEANGYMQAPKYKYAYEVIVEMGSEADFVMQMLPGCVIKKRFIFGAKQDLYSYFLGTNFQADLPRDKPIIGEHWVLKLHPIRGEYDWEHKYPWTHGRVQVADDLGRFINEI